MQQENLKTSLLDEQPDKTKKSTKQQLQNLSYVKKEKKRMMSSKKTQQQSKHVNTITKIFCQTFPIKSNYLLDTQCKSQIGFLFIGGYKVLNSQILKKNQIKAVLSVIDGMKFNKFKINDIVQDSDQIQQHQFIDLAQDEEDISSYLLHSYDWILDLLACNWNVLVHSYDGCSRAPAIVIHYLMKKYGLKYQEAYNIVKQRKPEMQLKNVFVEQLKRIKY